jgi:hypothetical protein
LQELPLNGRNWIDLTMLAAGARQNLSSDTPMGGAGNFQLNIDGQEVTNNMVQSFGQPKFSRDSIAEFEFVANRFDASQGRSMGVQVNAITKSGTNAMAGTFSGYFRDDSFIAKDFIQNRVLPYQNQQFSVTFGGPIKRDRIHYFTNFEYEREPETYSHSSPYPSFNFDQKSTRNEKKGGVRLDFQRRRRSRPRAASSARLPRASPRPTRRCPTAISRRSVCSGSSAGSWPLTPTTSSSRRATRPTRST